MKNNEAYEKIKLAYLHLLAHLPKLEKEGLIRKRVIICCRSLFNLQKLLGTFGATTSSSKQFIVVNIYANYKKNKYLVSYHQEQTALLFGEGQPM